MIHQGEFSEVFPRVKLIHLNISNYFRFLERQSFTSFSSPSMSLRTASLPVSTKYMPSPLSPCKCSHIISRWMTMTRIAIPASPQYLRDCKLGTLMRQRYFLFRISIEESLYYYILHSTDRTIPPNTREGSRFPKMTRTFFSFGRRF